MTIKCMDCKAETGEKCKVCGEKAVEFHPGLYNCLKCRRSFTKGDGGVTATFCDPCKAVRLAEIKAAPAR